MKAFALVVRRELARLRKRPALLFLLFAWPALNGMFHASIYSTRVVIKMPVAVCDEDNSAMSRLAVRYLDATRSLAVKYRVEGAEDLKAALLAGKVEAGVLIPRGFSADIKRGRPGTITAFVNGGNLLIANMTLSEVKTVAGTISAGARIKFLRKTGSSGAKALAGYAPVRVETFKLFNPGANYLNYLLPGIWGTVLQQLLLAFGSLLLAWEKDDHAEHEALEVAGGSTAVLLAGKFLPYALFFFIVLEFFHFAVFPLFAVPLNGSAPALTALNALFIYATLGLGLFVGSVSREAIDAMKGVLLVGAPALILSGYIWPISYMPVWIRPFALCIPLTHYLAALRKITQYGAGFSYILPQAAALLATGTLALAGAYFVTKYLAGPHKGAHHV